MNLTATEKRQIRHVCHRLARVMDDAASYFAEACASRVLFDIMVAFERCAPKWNEYFSFWRDMLAMIGMAPHNELLLFYYRVEEIRSRDPQQARDVLVYDLSPLVAKFAGTMRLAEWHFRGGNALFPRYAWEQEWRNILKQRNLWTVRDHGYGLADDGYEIPYYTASVLRDEKKEICYGGDEPAECAQDFVLHCSARLLRAYDDFVDRLQEEAALRQVLTVGQIRFNMNCRLLEQAKEREQHAAEQSCRGGFKPSGEGADTSGGEEPIRADHREVAAEAV